MTPNEPTIEKRHPCRTPGQKSRRRMVDALGLALFHLAIIGTVAWAFRLTSALKLIALMVFALDMAFLLIPPKRKPRLDDEPGKSPAVPRPDPRKYVLDCLLLLVPPAGLVGWFLLLIGAHQTLTLNQQIGVLIGIPVVVGLVSRIIYLRMTRHHKGDKGGIARFVAFSMLATWIGSTFLFFLFLAEVLIKNF